MSQWLSHMPQWLRINWVTAGRRPCSPFGNQNTFAHSKCSSKYQASRSVEQFETPSRLLSLCCTPLKYTDRNTSPRLLQICAKSSPNIMLTWITTLCQALTLRAFYNIQWDFSGNGKLPFWGNTFQNVVCKMSLNINSDIRRSYTKPDSCIEIAFWPHNSSLPFS